MAGDRQPWLSWPRLRRMFVLLGALVLGFGVGLGVYVITGQQQTITQQNSTLDRRATTIAYLQSQNAWQLCLLREDVKYKVAFLGGVVAFNSDRAAALKLLDAARKQLVRYEDIDKICPPPAAPKDPAKSRAKGG